MKKLLIALTILSVINMHANAGLNFTQINSNPVNANTPIFVNGKLVFQDEAGFLWLNSGSLNSSYQPLINGQKIMARNLVKTNGFVVFINQSDNNSLWSTDGETISRITESPLSYLNNRDSNVVVSKLIESGNFITTDGSDVRLYDIQPLTLNINEVASIVPSVCVFDDENLIFKAKDPSSSGTNFYLYQATNITPIQLEPDLRFVLKFGNHCYYRSFDYESRMAQHYKINNLGQVAVIDSFETEYFDDFFVFNDQLLMFLRPPSYVGSEFAASGQLYKLADDSSSPEELFSKDQTLIANSAWSTENYLYLYVLPACVGVKCSPLPPNLDQLTIYDTSLSLINTIYDNRFRDFSLYSTTDQDFAVLRGATDELTELEQGFMLASVKDPSVGILELIGGRQQNYYVHGVNLSNNKFGIYKISQQTVISTQLTGLWVSPNWQSQGLSIHTGIRSDGSKYIFVSFYLYRDNQPFWLAGTAELRTGEREQTIELSEFKGQSFLANDSTQTFEQINFGNIKIEPQSCNTIDITINSMDVETITLNMNRIENITYADLCTDD